VKGKERGDVRVCESMKGKERGYVDIYDTGPCHCLFVCVCESEGQGKEGV
jgi:hypothetical protein